MQESKGVQEDITSKTFQGLIDKIIVYRFTRNLDRELRSRRIAHSELSEATGRSKNWFNKTFNRPEDMRVSTFLKLFVAISEIAHRKQGPQEKSLTLQALFDEDLLRLTSLTLDLRTDDIEELAQLDPTLVDFLVGLRVYIEALKGVQKKVTSEEIDAFEHVLKNLEAQRR